MLVRVVFCLWLFIAICETARVKAEKAKRKESRNSESDQMPVKPYWKRKLYPVAFGSTGAKVDLCCPAGGNPQPFITWSFQNNTLPRRGKHKHHKYCLRIAKMSTKFAGIYQCVAQNTQGFQISHEYRLFHLIHTHDRRRGKPPNFEGELVEDQVISNGGCGQINCSIKINYALLDFGIVKINKTSKKLIKLKGTTTGSIGDNLQYFEYDIKHATSSDQGTYYCWAYVSGRYINKTIHITVSPSPDEIRKMDRVGFIITILLSTVGTALSLIFCANILFFRIRKSWMCKGSCDVHEQQTSTAIQTELTISSVNKYPPARRHVDVMMPGHLAPPNSAYGTTGDDTEYDL